MNKHEFMTPEEVSRLQELQAKAKRIQRAKKADDKFFRMADARKSELLARWGISPSHGSVEHRNPSNHN